MFQWYRNKSINFLEQINNSRFWNLKFNLQTRRLTNKTFKLL